MLLPRPATWEIPLINRIFQLCFYMIVGKSFYKGKSIMTRNTTEHVRSWAVKCKLRRKSKLGQSFFPDRYQYSVLTVPWCASTICTSDSLTFNPKFLIGSNIFVMMQFLPHFSQLRKALISLFCSIFTVSLVRWVHTVPTGPRDQLSPCLVGVPGR